MRLTITKLARYAVQSGIPVKMLMRVLKIEVAAVLVGRMGLSFDESASRLGVSVNTIRNWVAEGARNAKLHVAPTHKEIIFEYLVKRAESGAPGAAISQIYQRVTESRREHFNNNLNDEKTRMKSKQATDAEIHSYSNKAISSYSDPSMDEVNLSLQALVESGMLTEAADEDGLVRYQADPSKDGSNLKMSVQDMQQKLDDDSRYADGTLENMRRLATPEAIASYDPDNGTFFGSDGDYAGSSTRIWEIDPKDWPELYSKIVKSADKILQAYLKKLKQRKNAETTFSYFGFLGLHPKGGLQQWGLALLGGLSLVWGATQVQGPDNTAVASAFGVSHGTQVITIDPLTSPHRSHGTRGSFSHGTRV